MVRSLAMLGHQGSPRFLEAVQRCMATRAQVRQRGMSRASLQLSERAGASWSAAMLKLMGRCTGRARSLHHRQHLPKTCCTRVMLVNRGTSKAADPLASEAEESMQTYR